MLSRGGDTEHDQNASVQMRPCAQEVATLLWKDIRQELKEILDEIRTTCVWPRVASGATALNGDNTLSGHLGSQRDDSRHSCGSHLHPQRDDSLNGQRIRGTPSRATESRRSLSHKEDPHHHGDFGDHEWLRHHRKCYVKNTKTRPVTTIDDEDENADAETRDSEMNETSAGAVSSAPASSSSGWNREKRPWQRTVAKATGLVRLRYKSDQGDGVRKAHDIVPSDAAKNTETAKSAEQTSPGEMHSQDVAGSVPDAVSSSVAEASIRNVESTKIVHLSTEGMERNPSSVCNGEWWTTAMRTPDAHQRHVTSKARISNFYYHQAEKKTRPPNSFTTGAPGQHQFHIQHHRPAFRRRIASFVTSMPFDCFYGVMIVSNSLIIGIQADWSVRNETDEATTVYRVFDVFFCAIFTLEIVLRIYSFRFKYFVGRGWSWNVFDFIIVLLQLAEEFFAVLVSATNGASMNLSFLRILRIFRLIRIIRLARILKYTAELRALVLSIIFSLQSLVWTLILIILLTYVCCIMIIQLVADEFKDGMEGPIYEDLKNLYGSLLKTSLTLFQSITGGLDWNDSMRPLTDGVSAIIALPFIMYIAFAVFALLNVVTGVFVQAALTSASEDKDSMIILGMTEFFKTTAGPGGAMTWEEFENNLDSSYMQDYFKLIQIDTSEAHGIFRLLDLTDSGEINIDEFVSGCIRLRGAAKSLDLALLIHEVRRIEDKVSLILQAVDNDVDITYQFGPPPPVPFVSEPVDGDQGQQKRLANLGAQQASASASNSPLCLPGVAESVRSETEFEENVCGNAKGHDAKLPLGSCEPPPFIDGTITNQSAMNAARETPATRNEAFDELPNYISVGTRGEGNGSSKSLQSALSSEQRHAALLQNHDAVEVFEVA